MSRQWPEHTTILLVEDNLPTLQLLRSRLQLEGIQVLEAQNGHEALDHLKQTQVHAVITDLMMPAMDGFRLIQEIRELKGEQGVVPILVISANQNEADMVRCLASGADDFMSKPLSLPVLIERLWRLLRRR